MFQDLDETKRPSKAAKYSGWKASVDVLEAALTEQPYDGILGEHTPPILNHLNCTLSFCSD